MSSTYKLRRWTIPTHPCTIVNGGRIRSGKSYGSAAIYRAFQHQHQLDISGPGPSPFYYFHSDDKHEYYIDNYPPGTSHEYEGSNDDLPITYSEKQTLIIAEPFWNLDHACNIHPHIINRFFMEKPNRPPHTTLVQNTMFPCFLKKDIIKHVDYLILTREPFHAHNKRLYVNFDLERIFGSVELFCQMLDHVTTTLFHKVVIHLSCESNAIEDCVFWYYDPTPEIKPDIDIDNWLEPVHIDENHLRM